MAAPMMSTSSVVLLALLLLIVATNIPAIVGLGLPAVVLIVAMTAAELEVGHVLGGPDPDNRTTLAVACATRFPALALLVASLNFPNGKPLPIVVSYLLVSAVTVIPYMRWRKSQRKARTVRRGRLGFHPPV
jgi:BASS family bile acid:Na+ symporter